MVFKQVYQKGLLTAFTFVICVIAFLLCECFAVAQVSKQEMFERVFGEMAKLDPALVSKVKALPPGERLCIDRDGDGKKDEVWYIDTAKRHTKHPILLRVIDEDGDLDKNMGPDRDSDLYIVDWKADGTVDVAIDYQDNDGDGDVDEMGIYFFQPGQQTGEKEMMRCWWSYDNGDDNQLWYDVNWTYYQDLCQYRCHFSGNETFVSFQLPADSDHWIGHWENPFVFYDPDGDECSEVVVRFTGTDKQVKTLRYSFDADADAHGRRVHDYDFSITALAEQQGGAPALKLTDDLCFTTKLRSIPTTGVLRWDAAQEFARQSPWAKACLTWDEMNANIDGRDVSQDPNERWEGVLNRGSQNFSGVGGPPCSRFNKRNEIMCPASPLRLYYDPTDHRLHLLGAGPAEGWLIVDYDLDGKPDAKYTYMDDNRDGIFDRRQIDLDADGKPEFDWKMQGNDVRALELEYDSLSTFYKRVLTETLADSQQFIDAAKAALGDHLKQPEPVEEFFLTTLQVWQPSTQLGQRMRSTPAGARYYTDIIRDRFLHFLKKQYGEHQAWDRIEAAYAAGRYNDAAKLVISELAPNKQTESTAKFQSFSHRLPIHIDNSNGLQRDHCPIVLSLKDIQAAAKDFNQNNCAVVTPHRWIDWLEIPHQVDEIEPTVGRELSFLADLPANTKSTYWLYYSPRGKRNKAFPGKTRTGNSWHPPADVNIGWESAITAYRAYNGHFDFFGKTTYDHSRKVERLVYPIRKSYHEEQEWGVDALHVGNTSGLGGITLYEGDKSWIVRNPGGYTGDIKFTKRTLNSGPIRAAVEIKATNVIAKRPDLSVEFICIIYADHPESEIRASVNGADRSMLMAPGLVKLPRQESFVDKTRGCVGNWGWQENAIGDIGIGLIVPPKKLKKVDELKGETRLVCDVPNGTLRYWIIGDWLRGRRFPVAPTIANWQRELQELSTRVNRETPVTVGSAEELP